MSVPGDLVDARGIAQRYGKTPLRLAVDRALRLMGDARAHEIEVRQTGVMGTRYVDAEAILRAAMDGTPRVDEARIERAARAVYPHLTGEEWDDERFAFVAAMAREIAQDALAAADQEDTDA